MNQLTPTIYLDAPLGAPLVYLAGPIAGCSYSQAVDWRDYATDELAACNIKGLSPMRCKEYLSAFDKLSADCVVEGRLSVLSTTRAIMTRDRFDATRCNVLLVNLLGTEKVSIGTVMEIAWAHLKQIPVVVAVEQGNIHAEHAMVKEAIDFRCDTLADALETVKAILA